MSGLADFTQKYLKGVKPAVAEEWYNRSASRSLGGWVTEKIISALPGGKEAVSNLQRPKQESSPDTSIMEDVQAALGQMVDDPTGTAIEMGKDFLANPELIGFGALGGVRGGKRLAEMAKLGKAGQAAGAVAGSAFEGAVGMGALEAALQLKYDESDPKKVAVAATSGALINPLFQGTLAGAKSLWRNLVHNAEPPAQPTPPDATIQPAGPMDFERKLNPNEAGIKTKSGKIKVEGQPYESLRSIPVEERTAILKDLDAEARGIATRLQELKPAENGMPTQEQIDLSKRLQNITETRRTLQTVEPSSPLAREVVYRKEFGTFPEGDQPGFTEPNVQSPIDFAAFKAERTANPLIQRIQAARQAQVDAGFRTKEAEVDQAWKEYKAGQLRETELDSRRQELADIEDRLMQKVDKQKGSISTDQLVTLAALSGATAAGLYAYTHPEQQADIAAAAAAVGGVLATKGKLPPEVLARMSARALGPLLAEGKYTLKTLDRLPQNRTEFSPAQVRQEMNKPETPAGEKLALESVLTRAEAEGRKVTADELVSEFRAKTGDHTLTPKDTEEHADFGLEHIRGYSDTLGIDTFDTNVTNAAKTTIWQFPEYMEVSKSNHFSDPRYYGHTREFRENGVDYVVEIQSDLAQSLRKPMTPEERLAVEAEIAASDKLPPHLINSDRLIKLLLSLIYDTTTKATFGKASSKSKKELTAELNAHKKEFYNILSNPNTDPNLIDSSLTKLNELEKAVKEAQLGVNQGYAPLTPALRNAENRLIREKLAEATAKGDESVRFATADTVAKVENWPSNSSRIEGLKRRIKELEFTAVGAERYLSPSEWPAQKALYEKGIEELKAELEATKPGFAKPGHQSLYDRYAKETTSYLKKLGGKEVVDVEGHTWLEVPTGVKSTADSTEPRPIGGRPDSTGQGPIHMYGQADPRLLAGLAATGLAAAGYFALPEKQREGVKDYLQAVGALGVVAGVTRKVGKGTLTDTVRPAEGTRGSMTPDRAIKLGALASGAAVGGYIAGDERIAGAVIGGIGGLAATRLPALGRSIGKVISPQQAFGTAVRISAALGAGYYLGGKVDHPVEGAAIASAILLGRKFLKPNVMRESDAAINARNGNLKAWDRVRQTTVSKINQLVPEQARQEAISEALQVGARNHLSPTEQPVYDLVKQMNEEIGKDAIDANVLSSLRENYITSIVEFEPGIKKTEQRLLLDKVLGRLDAVDNAGPGTRFARARKYDTFTELNKAIEGTGLRIKTKAVGEIFNLYTKSMRKAIEDRILIDFHKKALAADGLPYIAKRDSYKRFPPGYRKIDHPQLKNLAVHPEAYDALKVILEYSEPNIVTAGFYGLSMAVKRSNVFGSLFHAKSLAEVYMLAMGSELLPKGIRDWKRPKTLIDQARQKFREGGLGDEIDGLLREGLKLEVPDDVSTTIIGDLGRLADSKFNTKLGSAAADKIDYVNKKTDKATWDYMHLGGKSAIGLKAVETLTINNAQLHARDPARYPLKSKQEIYREAARFANDVTGGLDWFRIATEAKTELGRSVAMYFASPEGRRLAQIVAFAPDWLISSMRASFNSFGKSETGFRGLLKPTNAVDLYRQYALRSAALWLTVLNGIQYGITGTPIWENKDPTRIEFKDGTSVQLGKHTFEAAHAVMDPVKFAMNKLGYSPSLAADVAAARYGAGPLAQSGDSITWHAVKKALPFTASPLVQSHLTPGQRIGRSISGGLGFPVYGMNPHQKLMARRDLLIEHARKRGER
jgi:hypothetical protein